MEATNWHTLMVRRNFERIVVAYLSRQGIESYLPVLPTVPAKQTRESLLFPGYVFCKCDAPDTLWTIPGVLSVLRGTESIPSMSELDIGELRRFLASR